MDPVWTTVREKQFWWKSYSKKFFNVWQKFQIFPTKYNLDQPNYSVDFLRHGYLKEHWIDPIQPQLNPLREAVFQWLTQASTKMTFEIKLQCFFHWKNHLKWILYLKGFCQSRFQKFGKGCEKTVILALIHSSQSQKKRNGETKQCFAKTCD